MRIMTTTNDPSVDNRSLYVLFIFKVMGYAHEDKHHKLKMEFLHLYLVYLDDKRNSAWYYFTRG